MTLISDVETEIYLHKLISPIFKTAGITFDKNKIFIIQDDSLNAFVSDGNNLFINTETIIKASSDDELRGVIAHETGHILGGHILRHKLRLNELQNISLASMIVAGAVGAVSGRGDIATAIALGTQSSLINKSLHYNIEEERSADESAISLLNKLHYSPQGLLNFMKKIKTQNQLNGINENAYFRTHPLTSERISFLQQATKVSSYTPQLTASNELKRIQAKLYAFIKNPSSTYIKYPANDDSIVSKYARVIADFKSLKFNKALKSIDDLIKHEPHNPHFKELKGQIFFELGKITEAKQEFAQSVKILPSAILFKINEAQASLELNPSSDELKKIISHLQYALTVQNNPLAWLLLSRAYHLDKRNAEAQYAAAYYSFLCGDMDISLKQAQKAKEMSIDPLLTVKIDDLINLIKQRN